MTFYEDMPPVRDRAVAMPHMQGMLQTLHRKHQALIQWVTADDLWQSYRAQGRCENRDLHIGAAIEAGFVEQHFNTGRYRITDKGRDVIGAPKPWWDVAA